MTTSLVHFLECKDILELETNWEQCGRMYESCSRRWKPPLVGYLEPGETCGHATWRVQYDNYEPLHALNSARPSDTREGGIK